MRSASLLFLSFLCGTLTAQVITPPGGGAGEQDTTEWRGWAGLSLQHRPWRSITVSLNHQWRWSDDFSQFDRRFVQGEVEWSPKGSSAVEAQSIRVGVRHTHRPDRTGDVQGMDRLIRWQIDYSVEGELGRWQFSGRARCQQQSALALKTGDDPATYGSRRTYRLKGTVEYNIKGWKWDPAISVERFLDRVPEDWQPDGAWRLRLATGRKTAKRQKVSLFVQRDWVGRYNPAAPGVALGQIGAGIDDLRLTGAVEWTAGVLYRYRFRKPGKKKDN